MAKPITPTPPVTGQMARRIQREIENGTPDTPQRVAMMKRADEAFRQSMEPALKNRDR